MAMTAYMSTRRLSEMTAAAIISLGGSIGPFCVAALRGELFRARWLRTTYLITTGVSWPCFLVGVGHGIRLLAHAQKKASRLLLPWNAIAALAFFSCAAGYANLIVAQSLWTYALSKQDAGWIVAVLAFCLLLLVGLLTSSIFTGVQAIILSTGLDDSTVSDSGEDVDVVSFEHEIVQFENSREFWTVEDDADTEPESKLQY